MSVFTYQAVRRTGEKVAGELQAESRNEAYRKLDRENLQPLALELKNGEQAQVEASDEAAAPTGPINLTRSQIILFTEELSDMLEAGLQLEPALRLMEGRSELSNLKQVTTNLRQYVREGSDLSVAMRIVSPSFGELYCNLVAAGEVSGALPQLLKRQAGFLQTMDELRSRVVQALIYPAVLFLAGVAVMFLFITVLVPQLTMLFTRTGRDMPIPTRVLIGAGDFFFAWWWAIVLVLILGTAGFIAYTRQPAGRLWWDRARLRMPFIGPILMSRFYAQFSQTLGNLVSNGVPLLLGLKLMNRTSNNIYLQRLIDQIIEIVGEGGSISRAFRRSGFFSPLFSDLIAVGEQTGDLGAALTRTGQRFEKELNTKIQRLTALVPPVIITVMAVLVGVVAYSIITGIFQSMSGLRPGGGA